VVVAAETLYRVVEYPEGVGNVRDVGDGDELFDHPIAAWERSNPMKILDPLMKDMLEIDIHRISDSYR
jgi:hypothetical protein